MSDCLLSACIIGTGFALTILCKSLSESSPCPFYISFGTPTEPLLVSVLVCFVYLCQTPHSALFLSVSECLLNPCKFRYQNPSHIGTRTPTAPFLQGFQIHCNIGFGFSFAARILRSFDNCPNMRNPSRCKGRTDWPLNSFMSCI